VTDIDDLAARTIPNVEPIVAEQPESVVDVVEIVVATEDVKPAAPAVPESVEDVQAAN
jgi:hypothetical protein